MVPVFVTVSELRRRPVERRALARSPFGPARQVRYQARGRAISARL